jgi:hypothetical protein
VAYSPDGRRLASAGYDRTVKVWDAATGQNLLTLKGHTGEVSDVAYSPDGRRLASASRDGTVKMWDAATSQDFLTLQGHTSAVLLVVYSPDGSRLASTSQDQTVVKLWDAATGQNFLTLTGHTGWVSGVAYSPDSRRLASASHDQTVKVWDAATGQELLTLKGHTGEVSDVAYSPDVGPFWRGRVRYEAARLVAPLFAKGLLRSEVLAAVRADARLNEAVRQEALTLAETFPEDANALNEASWAVVRQPGVDAAAYQRALHQAEAANRLTPKNPSILNTLGVAYYRLGNAAKARGCFERANMASHRQGPAACRRDNWWNWNSFVPRSRHCSRNLPGATNRQRYLPFSGGSQTCTGRPTPT